MTAFIRLIPSPFHQLPKDRSRMTDTKKDLAGESAAVEIEADTSVGKKSNFQKYAESNSVGGLSFVLRGSSKTR